MFTTIFQENKFRQQELQQQAVRERQIKAAAGRSQNLSRSRRPGKEKPPSVNPNWGKTSPAPGQ